MNALFKNISDSQYNIIKDAAVKSNAFTKTFSSVSGENDVIAILCVLPEIELNGFKINNFPFYLIDNREKPVVLLGYDFLTSCDVVQGKDSNLRFYNFDIKSMRTKMKSTNALKLLSVKL